ncbi:GIY-YIG nuclease family protein [Paenibacillus sp. FSL R5-0519]|uniref:GIY-YIG nuclease family protein n=1 Tax=Paenibacillus sp. FSL R5-0519 TaxID=2921648 RepID=UPI0030DC4B12
MTINITVPQESLSLDILSVRRIMVPQIIGKSGIYVFYDVEEKPLYVGKSKDLNRRINEHLGLSPYPFDNRAVTVKVYLEDDPTSVDIYESFMISKLEPEYNRAGNYSDGFQRQNADELFDLEVRLSEAEDEERTLSSFIHEQEAAVMYEELTEVEDFIEALRDIGHIRRKISELKREIGVRKRRSSKAVKSVG